MKFEDYKGKSIVNGSYVIHLSLEDFIEMVGELDDLPESYKKEFFPNGVVITVKGMGVITVVHYAAQDASAYIMEARKNNDMILKKQVDKLSNLILRNSK